MAIARCCWKRWWTRLEKAVGEAERLRAAQTAYIQLYPALDPDILCTFDKPNQGSNRWWRECRINASAVSETSGILEGRAKALIGTLCGRIEFFEPVTACHDKALTLIKAMLDEIKDLKVDDLKESLDNGDKCLTI